MQFCSRQRVHRWSTISGRALRMAAVTDEDLLREMRPPDVATSENNLSFRLLRPIRIDRIITCAIRA
jgi:hypothetical protein